MVYYLVADFNPNILCKKKQSWSQPILGSDFCIFGKKNILFIKKKLKLHIT